MGKIRTRVLGLEDLEDKQKQDQKERAEEKKVKKSATETKDAAVELKDKKTSKKVEKQKAADDKKTAVKESKAAQKDAETKKTESGRSKKYMAAVKKVDPKKIYSLPEAIALLKKIKYANFDESLELHINLDEQGLRGEVDLPHSIGKTVRVAIVDEKVIEAIEKGIIDFDVLISHPSFMPKLVKFAKTLGPRGLMPNPKTGTVSTNPEETKNKFTKGVIRWKSEPKFPLLHQLIGKISYKDEDIAENVMLYLKSVGKVHIKKAFIKTTMSPSLRLDVDSI